MAKPVFRSGCSTSPVVGGDVIVGTKMAARSRRGAAGSAEVHRENGKGEGPSRKTIETIKDATGQQHLAAHRCLQA